MPSSLPPIDAALVPLDVRTAGPEAQRLYTAALSFESTLTRQLAEALVVSTEDESEGGETDVLKRMLPDALAQGIAGAGGLGLAPQLYAALKGTA